MKPLRVAVVAPPFYEIPPDGYGGIERVCASIVDGLARRGHDVTLIASGTRRVAGRFVQTLPVAPGEDTGDDVGVELLHAARAHAAVSALKPDIVHHHSRAGLLMHTGGRASVATVHGAVSGPESEADYHRALGGRVPLVAVSDAQRRTAAELAWAGTVHNGVDPDAYPFRESKDDYLLYLGRLSWAKGADIAVAAAVAAGRRLVVAGGPTSASERQWAELVLRRETHGGVEFVGEVSGHRRLALLAGASCLVHPSRWEEPFGLAVVEAMACGTPVVATRRGALPELVHDGVTGVLVGLSDEAAAGDDVAAAVEQAVGLSPRACRARVVNQFSADRMVSGYLAIYRQLLD